MKVFLIILGHVIGIALLLGLGIRFNEALGNRYAGVVSLFTFAFGIYTAILNFLYHRNLAFHLFVNRVKLRLRPTHTYWQPHFTMTIAADAAQRGMLLDEIWQMLSSGEHGTPQRRESTPTTLAVALDDLFVVRFRLDEQNLYMDFDLKLLVPSHRYDEFRRRLANLAERVAQLAGPTAVQCCVIVSFEQQEKNPYFGLFVNRVQPELLQSFQVAFRIDANSSCRVEAGNNYVNIESRSLTELFEALRTVVSLKALPNERHA